jgi:hypothetical protein
MWLRLVSIGFICPGLRTPRSLRALRITICSSVGLVEVLTGCANSEKLYSSIRSSAPLDIKVSDLRIVVFA